MLLYQFVYICTHFAAICFTKRHFSNFSPFSVRICTARFFFIGLAHPTVGVYICYAHFSLFHIIN